MTFTVQVQPGNLSFFVEDNEAVLDAALRQGFDFNYGCQHGTCGTCAAQLLQGNIHYGDVDPLGLEEEETAANFILLCSAIPETDLVIQHTGASAPWQMPLKKLPYRIAECKQLSNSIMQLLLEPPTEEAIRFRAGQYVEVFNAEGEHRPFSIANAPLGGKHIELHVHHREDNPFSVAIMEAARKEGTLWLQGPYGSCVARMGVDYPLIFIAGGTGFSQSKALIEAQIQQAPQTPMHLFWGAKTPADLYLDELPRHWQQTLPNFKYTPTLSRVDGAIEWQGHRTSLPQLIHEFYPDLSQHLVYASGPSALSLDTWATLKEYGLKPAYFNSDIFDFMEKPE